MICHICNATLTPEGISWNRDHKDWEPCGTCLAVINEVFEHTSEQDIDYQLSVEFPEDPEEDSSASEEVPESS